MQYGIPYKGSKSRIAESIIRKLPPGKRLVDLFGGGFSISHCGLLSGKWQQVLYNDIDPLLVPTIRKAIHGDYNYSRFKPEFITREAFQEMKTKDGYIKYVWSYGNNGNDYMFGRDKEHIKHIMHDFVVFGIYSHELDELAPDLEETITEKDITERRCHLYRILNERKYQLQELFQLERLARLETLKADNLIMHTGDYRDYEYQEGDIVYCDIPYEQSLNRKKDYGGEFDFNEFIQWAMSREYPVYFSSYDFIKRIWHKEILSTMNSGKGAVKRTESLYVMNDTKQENEQLTFL